MLTEQKGKKGKTALLGQTEKMEAAEALMEELLEHDAPATEASAQKLAPGAFASMRTSSVLLRVQTAAPCGCPRRPSPELAPRVAAPQASRF